MKGGLQQPHSGCAPFVRTVEHSLHQPAPDRSVLRGRINRDRPDAGDRAALIDEVAADQRSVLLGDHRVKSGIGQQHRENVGRYLRRRKIPGEIVLVVDCLERLEADWTASGGIRRRAGSQHDAHVRFPPREFHPRLF